MTDNVEVSLLNQYTPAIDVRAVKKAKVQANLIAGDATTTTAAVLTIQYSSDGDWWTSSGTTLTSIDTDGVTTAALDVDGVAFIRTQVTTASANFAVVGVTVAAQVEV